MCRYLLGILFAIEGISTVLCAHDQQKNGVLCRCFQIHRQYIQSQPWQFHN